MHLERAVMYGINYANHVIFLTQFRGGGVQEQIKLEVPKRWVATTILHVSLFYKVSEEIKHLS